MKEGYGLGRLFKTGRRATRQRQVRDLAAILQVLPALEMLRRRGMHGMRSAVLFISALHFGACCLRPFRVSYSRM